MRGEAVRALSRKRTQGFTIVEALLSVAMGAVVLVGAFMVYDASQSTARKDERVSDLQQNARSALDMLVSQIRLAGYLNLRALPNRIAIGTDTLLVVRGDVQLGGGAGVTDTLFAVQPNATAVCAAPPCLVTGTTVYTVNAAQAVTAFNVSAVTFQYFDLNNNVLAAPLDGVVAGAFPDGVAAPNPLPGTTTARDTVRKIRVTLTATNASVSAGPGPGSTAQQITLTSDIRFRNAD